MANDRVTQLPVEVVHAGEGSARVSDLDVEVIHAGESAARLSQLSVEAVVPIIQSDLHQLLDIGILTLELHQLFDIGAISDLHQVFDIGALDVELHQRFDLGFALPESTLHQFFDVTGRTVIDLHQLFDVEGDIAADLRQLFDVLAPPPTANEIQTITSSGVTGGTYPLTFAGQTTGDIAATANAATVQAALEALSNIAPGDVVVTGGPLTTSPLTVTFGGAYAGVDVPQITIDATDLTGPDEVTTTATTSTNGGPITSGGQQLAEVPLLWHPLMVFDKAGSYIGSITTFNVPRPPTRYLRSTTVGQEGAMTFHVSRHSPELDLLESDRLVRLQSLAGEIPWWGTMGPKADAGGIIEVECADPFTVLRDGLAIELEQKLEDNTPATAVYAKVIAMHNELRATTGEIQWELDSSGSRPFRGNIAFDGDTMQILDTVIRRSRTEIAWDSRLEGNRLVPILRVRDRFEDPGGAAIFDGDAGNVTTGVRMVEDPTPMVFSLRLRGETTDLAECLPEWAEWALLNITPEVVASVDPGAYRNRQVRDESVDWGLSNAAIAAQCNAIVDWLTELYHSFLRAIHDIEGRPWHDGWAFVGPPDEYEPKTNGKDSLSRRAWKHRLQLVEARPNEPASAVMISDTTCQINLREWLIVRYNRRTGVQNVTVWAIPSVTGASLIKWEVDAGSAWLYEVSGGRVIGRTSIATTGAFVDPYNERIWDPSVGRYRNLRRIINGPFALRYYIDPSDADNSFVDLGVEAAISTTAGDGSSLIAKIYDFEARAIENWDPRRDGIGIRKAVPTVFASQPTTRPRWHVISFNVGGDAQTSLTQGIGSGDTTIEVDSIFGFPDPDSEPLEFPFLVSIDDGLDAEQVLVTGMVGTLWTVIRGQAGTDAILHEPGATVFRVGVESWQGFPWSPELSAWPEGQQWADELLAELSKPRVDLGIHVGHFRGDELTVGYGSMHDIDVATEGPAARWIGEGRVIGWSTNPAGAETEVVLEWQQ